MVEAVEQRWQTDSSLLAQVHGAQGGDVAAQRALFDRFQRSVMSYCLLSAHGDRELALDLTQESFTRAFGSLKSLENPERFQGWLFTLVANICRSRGAQRTRQEKVLEAVMLEREASTEDPAQRERLIARVQEVLHRVEDPTVRRLALLHYVDGRTTRDIAALLGMPHGTVTVKLMRFRAAIKADLCQILIEEAS